MKPVHKEIKSNPRGNQFFARLLIGAAAISSPGLVFAQSVSMTENMKTLADLILAFTPFFGFLIFAAGIYQFYKHSKTKDERYGTASSLAKIIAGAFLVSINWFYGFLANSFISAEGAGGSGARMLLAMDKQMAEGTAIAVNQVIPAETVSGLLGFIAVVGIISFISGLMALKNLGDGRHDERDLYKAITRIVGGLCCLNIKWVACFIGQIFGVSMLCG